MLREFAGREAAVEYSGQQRKRSVTLSASLSQRLSSPAWNELERLADQLAPACYRDPDGTRMFVSMGGIGGSQFGSRRVPRIGWTLTETDWHETVEGA